MSWRHMPFLMLNSSPPVTNWPGFWVAFWLPSNQVTRLPGSTKTSQALGCSRNSGRKRLHSWAPTSTMTSPGGSGYDGTWNLHGAWRCVRHVSLWVTKVQRVIFEVWKVRIQDETYAGVLWCMMIRGDLWWSLIICVALWWLMMRSFVMICDDVSWFMLNCDDFAVI